MKLTFRKRKVNLLSPDYSPVRGSPDPSCDGYEWAVMPSCIVA